VPVVSGFGRLCPVRHFAFINFDDPTYVTRNRHVTGGLTKDNLRWAFTATEGANWFPLTWISMMADVQLFGAGAGPQHVTNVLIHAASTLLLFWLMKRMTGATFPVLRWPFSSRCIRSTWNRSPG